MLYRAPVEQSIENHVGTDVLGQSFLLLLSNRLSSQACKFSLSLLPLSFSELYLKIFCDNLNHQVLSDMTGLIASVYTMLVNSPCFLWEMTPDKHFYSNWDSYLNSGLIYNPFILAVFLRLVYEGICTFWHVENDVSEMWWRCPLNVDGFRPVPALNCGDVEQVMEGKPDKR